MTIPDKISGLESLKEKIRQWKLNGEKIVFTNGVFDLLHKGHVTYLVRAAELGNKLVIGLNSDESVKRLKGPTRPINSESSRALILATMFFIDAVVLFEEDTPLQFIKTLLPDVLVKGADYAIEDIAGGKEVIANGGEVKTIAFVDGYSSTSIIKRMQSQ